MAIDTSLTAPGYITHHLGNWTNTGHPQTAIADFHVLNYDTIVMSIICAVLAAVFMYSVARRVSAGVPTRTQALLEMVVDLVDDQAKSSINGDRGFIAPFAMTVFVWVFLMNALDFLPLDFMHNLFGLLHINLTYFRPVPTADLNGTLGISVGVCLLMFYYGIKVHGAGGFVKGLFTAPFHGSGFVSTVLLAPINLIENALSYGAKTVSLAMRLFGNMYAGELIFMLIALLGATHTWWGFPAHFLLGSMWAIFHILIVFLQAFVVMMLSLVYLGQAHDGH
jgi:F-type H+-transporting ATPase subunit a